MRPGDPLDVLHIPANMPVATAERVKRVWRNETGRECVVLSGATYGGTVTYEVVDAHVVDGFTAQDMAQAYQYGVQDLMLRATQIERVLTDLIAELRDGKECYCSGQECGVDAVLDRAEARLREVSMSLNKGHDDE